MELWKRMRGGNVDLALQAMEADYRANSTPSLTVQLGIGYLWCRLYESAALHFDNYNKRYPKQTDFMYGLAGTARWCLSDFQTAVEIWREGLDCDYADSPGGVHNLLLLFFAAKTHPELDLPREFRNLQGFEQNYKKIANWPGPILQFLVGDITYAEAIRLASRRDSSGVEVRELHLKFWNAVSSYSPDAPISYHDNLLSYATLDWDDFDRDPALFIDKIWCEEFFIARFELESINRPKYSAD